MKGKIIRKKANSIFTRSKLPSAKWTINPYVGCLHACSYCYAKFMGRFRPESYGEWGSWVEAKVNAPQLAGEKYVEGQVYMSSISDPYQPVEEKLRITRGILKNLDKRTNLCIQTKSDLVLRDLKLLKKFEEIEVGFTINSFKGKLKDTFEPGSPSNKRRVSALKVLKKEGVKTFAFLSPIMPGLINLKSVIRKTKPFADYYWFEFINLNGAGSKFKKLMRNEFPETLEVLREKEKFKDFVKRCKRTIYSTEVKVRDIITHQ